MPPIRALSIGVLLLAPLLALKLTWSQSAHSQSSTTRSGQGARDTKAYIPQNLEDSLRALQKVLTPAQIAQINAAKEDDMVLFHRSLGMGLRSDWGLWSGSRLARYFNTLGIRHPDDMSGIILTSLWRRLHGQPLRLQEQVQEYQDYWKAVHAAASQEQRRVAWVRATIKRQMLGLRLVTKPVPNLKLPRRTNEGLNIRFLAHYKDGLLLSAKEYRDSSRLTSSDIDFFTPCYYLDLHQRIIHPVRVAELDRIEEGLVVGDILYLHGTRKGQTRLLGIRKHKRFFLPVPPSRGWLRLGQDGPRLLAVRPHGVYRWTGQKWQTLCSTQFALPPTGVPPTQIGSRIYFRDEGVNEDNKRLSWLDLTHPQTLTYFDEDVGLVGAEGPRWETVHSFGATSNGALWIATGSFMPSLVLRRANGSYGIGLFNGSIQAMSDLLGGESSMTHSGAGPVYVTGVLAAGHDRTVVVGSSGLYNIQGQAIHPLVHFYNTQQEIPEETGVLHWEWIPTHIASLAGGDFILGGHFGGTYLLDATSAGSYRLVSLDEKLGQPVRF